MAAAPQPDPPPGFVLESTPPPPPGFVLESSLPLGSTDSGGFQSPPPPPGFVLEQTAPQPEPRTLSEQTFRELGQKDSALSRGILDDFKRGSGLAARTIVSAPALAVAGLADLTARGVNFAASNIPRRGPRGGDVTVFEPDAFQRVQEGFTRMGFPEPEGAVERTIDEAGRFAFSAGVPIRAGAALRTSPNPVTRRVGDVLESNQALQGVSGATAGTASQVTEELGGGPVAQFVAGMVGAAFPAAATLGTQAAIRGTVRGGEAGRQVVAENLETFGRAGTTPSIAQATQGRGAQAFESGLARTPGGAGRIADKARTQAAEIAERVEQRANQLAPKATATRAGLAIEKGISGKGGLVERFRTTSRELYDNVDQHIDTSQRIAATSTSNFLTKAAAPIPGAAATSETLANKFLTDLRVAFEADLQGGGIPYLAMKQLRTQVGQKMGDLPLVSDVSKGQLKRLYAALSTDLTEAARNAGPNALKAAQRANGFYKAGRSRIEAVERVVDKNGGPEKVFAAAMSGTKEGATTLRTVMKSIPPEQRKIVTAAVVRRMGKATPGRQDPTGEAFSIETYLTNWSRLSPEAKGVLFGRFGPKFSRDMNALARLAGNIREGSKVFSNPSGTQQALSLQATNLGAIFAAITGQFEIAAGLAALPAMAKIGARAMTNPTFVRWLAQTTQVRPGAYPAQVQQLARMAELSKDEDLALIVGLLEEAQNARNQ